MFTCTEKRGDIEMCWRYECCERERLNQPCICHQIDSGHISYSGNVSRPLIRFVRQFFSVRTSSFRIHILNCKHTEKTTHTHTAHISFATLNADRQKKAENSVKSFGKQSYRRKNVVAISCVCIYSSAHKLWNKWYSMSRELNIQFWRVKTTE